MEIMKTGSPIYVQSQRRCVRNGYESVYNLDILRSRFPYRGQVLFTRLSGHKEIYGRTAIRPSTVHHYTEESAVVGPALEGKRQDNNDDTSTRNESMLSDITGPRSSVTQSINTAPVATLIDIPLDTFIEKSKSTSLVSGTCSLASSAKAVATTANSSSPNLPASSATFKSSRGTHEIQSSTAKSLSQRVQNIQKRSTSVMGRCQCRNQVVTPPVYSNTTKRSTLTAKPVLVPSDMYGCISYHTSRAHYGLTPSPKRPSDQSAPVSIATITTCSTTDSTRSRESTDKPRVQPKAVSQTFNMSNFAKTARIETEPTCQVIVRNNVVPSGGLVPCDIEESSSQVIRSDSLKLYTQVQPRVINRVTNITQRFVPRSVPMPLLGGLRPSYMDRNRHHDIVHDVESAKGQAQRLQSEFLVESRLSNEHREEDYQTDEQRISGSACDNSRLQHSDTTESESLSVGSVSNEMAGNLSSEISGIVSNEMARSVSNEITISSASSSTLHQFTKGDQESWISPSHREKSLRNVSQAGATSTATSTATTNDTSTNAITGPCQQTNSESVLGYKSTTQSQADQLRDSVSKSSYYVDSYSTKLPGISTFMRRDTVHRPSQPGDTTLQAQPGKSGDTTPQAQLSLTIPSTLQTDSVSISAGSGANFGARHWNPGGGSNVDLIACAATSADTPKADGRTKEFQHGVLSEVRETSLTQNISLQSRQNTLRHTLSHPPQLKRYISPSMPSKAGMVHDTIDVTSSSTTSVLTLATLSLAASNFFNSRASPPLLTSTNADTQRTSYHPSQIPPVNFVENGHNIQTQLAEDTALFQSAMPLQRTSNQSVFFTTVPSSSFGHESNQASMNSASTLLSHTAVATKYPDLRPTFTTQMSNTAIKTNTFSTRLHSNQVQPLSNGYGPWQPQVDNNCSIPDTPYVLPGEYYNNMAADYIRYQQWLLWQQQRRYYDDVMRWWSTYQAHALLAAGSGVDPRANMKTAPQHPTEKPMSGPSNPMSIGVSQYYPTSFRPSLNVQGPTLMSSLRSTVPRQFRRTYEPRANYAPGLQQFTKPNVDYTFNKTEPLASTTNMVLDHYRALFPNVLDSSQLWTNFPPRTETVVDYTCNIQRLRTQFPLQSVTVELNKHTLSNSVSVNPSTNDPISGQTTRVDLARPKNSHVIDLTSDISEDDIQITSVQAAIDRKPPTFNTTTYSNVSMNSLYESTMNLESQSSLLSHTSCDDDVFSVSLPDVSKSHDIQRINPQNQRAKSLNSEAVDIQAQTEQPTKTKEPNNVNETTKQRAYSDTSAVKGMRDESNLPSVTAKDITTLESKLHDHKASRLLNPVAVLRMKEWLEAHRDHPYPTSKEKRILAQQGNITVVQVSSWFANKRNRVSVSHKAKTPMLHIYSQQSENALGSGKENSQSGSDSDHNVRMHHRTMRHKRGLSEMASNENSVFPAVRTRQSLREMAIKSGTTSSKLVAGHKRGLSEISLNIDAQLNTNSKKTHYSGKRQRLI